MAGIQLQNVRPAVLTAGIALATVFAAGPAQAATAPVDESCRPGVLPVPPGMNYSVVDAVDPSGRWLVSSGRDRDDVDRLFLSDDGTVIDLGDAVSSAATSGVNSAGTVIGSSGGHSYSAWKYRDGRVVQLPGTSTGDSVFSSDINEDGTVVGEQLDAGTQLSVPLRWSPAGVVAALPLLPGDNYAEAQLLDGDGAAVGTGGFDARDTHTLTSRPVYWAPDGTIQALRLPDAVPDAAITLVAIRGGAIFGHRRTADGSRQGLVWDSPAATPRVFADGAPQAVSRDGGDVVVRDHEDRLWLLHDGVRRELTDPRREDDRAINRMRFAGVTNTGVVYGSAYAWENDTATHVSYRWACG
jgi:hypothetical protein